MDTGPFGLYLGLQCQGLDETSYFELLNMRYKRFKFGCDQSVTKVTII